MRDLIQVKDGQPVTNTFVIAKACGLKHSNLKRDLKALIDGGYIDVSEFEHIFLKDSYGRKQEAIELNESGFLMAMPYICGRKGLEGQRALITEFLRLRQRHQTPESDLLSKTQEEQASIAGRGLANYRWKKPVFVFQLPLPGLELAQ